VSPSWISIKTKVALVICLISGVSFGIFFSLNYRDTSARIHAHAEEMIARDHQTHMRHILDTLTTMAQDSETIIGAPPISGIFRTLQTPSQIDPLDGSTLAQWRQRLETLFTSMIRNRRAYSQIRLLLPRGNWREFTRVNLSEGALRVVPQEHLQSKGAEPYIKALTAPPLDQIQFSNVTRNREHGVATGPPSLRALKRVLDPEGNVAGAIVINAHVAELFSLPDHDSDIGHSYYAFENTAQAVDDLAPEDIRFVVDTGADAPAHITRQVFGAAVGRLISIDDHTGLFVTRIDSTAQRTPFTIRIATTVDRHQLLAVARAELRRNLFNALCLTLFASCMGYLLTSRVLAPLEDLLQEIRTSGRTLRPLDAQIDGHDEVSVIARGFAQLTNNLIRETRRLDMVLSNAAEGVVTLRKDGAIEDVNPAVTRILGQSEARLIGRKLTDVLDCTPAMTPDVLLSASGQDNTTPPVRMTVTTRSFAGEEIVLQVAARHALYAEGSRFIVMLRDVTAETFAAQNSEALISALKKSNAELDQFAYVASHDLKAPLRVINNAISWLEEDLEPYLDDDTRESMHLLQSRASRMERLLNDLLQHSRIGRVAEPDIQVTGHDMANELLELLDVPDGMEIRFSREFLELTLRKLPLETVLVNLISNSIKHHDLSTGQIMVDVTRDDRFMQFRVEDDGPGIDPIYHERIFEVFQTLQSRDQLDSSGMGLAFVKKHIEVAGGDIEVLSDGTRGTIFQFRWPRDLPQQNKAA